MSSIEIDLPESLHSKLEITARRLGMSVSELLVDAIERMSQVESLESIKDQARRRDTRSAFEKVLAAVPDVPPADPGDVIGRH